MNITTPFPKAGAAPTRVDPITAAVIQGALENIAIEMGHKLMRMSYSSIIRESEDFGAALTDAQGRQLCECKMSTPLQSGPIPGYVRGILKVLARRGDEVRPGDVIMHNDPYGGASHGPDVAFCVPIFLERRAHRIFDDHRPSPGYRRIDPGQLRHRRRRGYFRRRIAVQGDQSLRPRPPQRCGLAHAARQHSRPRSRRRRYGGADQGR